MKMLLEKPKKSKKVEKNYFNTKDSPLTRDRVSDFNLLCIVDAKEIHLEDSP